MADTDDPPAGFSARNWLFTLTERVPGISAAGVAVAAVLVQHADFSDGAEARPSVATLARLSGRNERTVRAALAGLEEAGVIERTGTLKQVTVWRCVPSGSTQTPGERPGVDVTPPGERPGHPGRETRSPRARDPVTPGERPDNQSRPIKTNQPTSARDGTSVPATAGAGAHDDDGQGGGGVDPLEEVWSGLGHGLGRFRRPDRSESLDSDIRRALALGWSPAALVEAVCRDEHKLTGAGGAVIRIKDKSRHAPPPDRPTASKCQHGTPNGTLQAADGSLNCHECNELRGAALTAVPV